MGEGQQEQEREREGQCSWWREKMRLVAVSDEREKIFYGVLYMIKSHNRLIHMSSSHLRELTSSCADFSSIYTRVRARKICVMANLSWISLAT